MVDTEVVVAVKILAVKKGRLKTVAHAEVT